MNSEVYKQKFGVSKTTYKNMKKQQLLESNGEVSELGLLELRAVRKKRRKAADKLRQSKHSLAKAQRGEKKPKTKLKKSKKSQTEE